jgi:glutaredoxin 3
MANVEIYTWSTCPFCLRAKALLKKKGIDFTEYCIDGDEEARKEMAKRANGRRSMPQIFIDNQPIGGSEDLYELASSGELEELLGTSVG